MVTRLLHKQTEIYKSPPPFQRVKRKGKVNRSYIGTENLVEKNVKISRNNSENHIDRMDTFLGENEGKISLHTNIGLRIRGEV